MTVRALGSPVVSALRTEPEGPVLRVTMTRPGRRNALDASLIAELTEVFADVGGARVVGSPARPRRSLRAPTSSGCGPRSSSPRRRTCRTRCAWRDAGCDRRLPRSRRRARAGSRARGRRARRVCDMDADPGTEFAFSEVKLGIVPAVISPFALAKIGSSAARRLFVTGERFGADVALRIGLVHEVTGELDVAVERVIGELLSAGPTAARGAKERARAPLSADETTRRNRRAPHERRRPGRACARSSRSATRPGGRPPARTLGQATASSSPPPKS